MIFDPPKIFSGYQTGNNIDNKEPKTRRTLFRLHGRDHDFDCACRIRIHIAPIIGRSILTLLDHPSSWHNFSRVVYILLRPIPDNFIKKHWSTPSTGKVELGFGGFDGGVRLSRYRWSL